MRACSSARRRSRAPAGNLVFTGVEDDPETLATLRRMGFATPHHVANAIRGWHHGRIRATRSARARELLTKLVPGTARRARRQRRSRRRLHAVRPLRLQPAGWRAAVLAVPGAAGAAQARGRASPDRRRRLAAHLAQTPATLDALLDADFLDRLPSRDALAATLGEQLARAPGYRSQARRRAALRQGADLPRRRADHRGPRQRRRRRTGPRQRRRMRGDGSARCEGSSRDDDARARRALRGDGDGKARRARDDGRVRSRPHLRLRCAASMVRPRRARTMRAWRSG